MPNREELALKKLDRLRGTARKQSANVRALARFAANARCPTARLGFAARVDFDRLLVGTRFAAPFGQSPFAFRRGNRFEERLRVDGHRPVLELLERELGCATAHARVENLRDVRHPTIERLAERARRTAELLTAIVRGRKDAPNLIDGAVLARKVGGIRSFFEADAVAARLAEPIYAGEVKSFPTVDGQADPEKLGAALAQVAIYILLLRELVESLGGDPSRVSADALIITPRNTGLQPTLTVKSVAREVDRASRVLASVPSSTEIVAELPDDVPSFGEIVEEKGRSETERIETTHRLIERADNLYRPSCLATCGLARLCRDRAHACGELSRFGSGVGRLLPGVVSIDRVVELQAGATPSPHEAPVAERLVQARRLLDDFARPRASAWGSR